MNPLSLILLLALGQQPTGHIHFGSGPGTITAWQLPCGLTEPDRPDCPKPEPIDVPAIETEVEEWVPCPSYAGAECTNYLHQDGSMSLEKRAMVKHISCEDSRRIGPLASADGKWHCLLFK